MGMQAVAELARENAQLKDQVSHLQGYVEQLEQALVAARQQRFGPSSEKRDTGQILLFDEAEVDDSEHTPDTEPTEDETVPVAAHRRTKRGRQPLPASLPRVDVIHDLPDEDKVCALHGVPLQAAGEKTNEQLDIIPATLQVLRHIRRQYRCPCCDDGLVTAPKPADPIPKSNASPGTLAAMATYKYADGLPLYRQVAMLQRIGIDLDRGTLANWMIRGGILIQPLINLLRDRLLAASMMHLDETPVQVLKEAGRPAQSTSYMWVQASRAGSTQPVILFDYDPSRGKQVPERLLTGYTGAIMVDGYESYDAVCRGQGIRRLGCWAHARRKFVDAAKVAGKKKGKSAKVDYALKLIGKLYKIERAIKDLKPEERQQQRQVQARPILDKLRAWLIQTQPTVPPKLALGKALNYLHGQWPRLIRYLDDGDYPIDNNRVENAIRPFVIGRKGWLFSTSVAGAKASANLYSLIETAKANQLNPYTYLKQIFTELPRAESVDAIEALLPWKINKKNQEG